MHIILTYVIVQYKYYHKWRGLREGKQQVELKKNMFKKMNEQGNEKSLFYF